MSATDGKSDRLAAALRANLARRKAQLRARRDKGEGETPDEAKVASAAGVPEAGTREPDDKDVHP